MPIKILIRRKSVIRRSVMGMKYNILVLIYFILLIESVSDGDELYIYNTYTNPTPLFNSSYSYNYDNPEIIILVDLLKLYWRIIDPTLRNRQGNDAGNQYRTGIYYIDDDDAPIIKKSREVEQKNYTEIISRLRVLWKEKRSTKNQGVQQEQKPIEPELKEALDQIGNDDEKQEEKPAEVIEGEVEEKELRTFKKKSSPMDPPKVPQAE